MLFKSILKFRECPQLNAHYEEREELSNSGNNVHLSHAHPELSDLILEAHHSLATEPFAVSCVLNDECHLEADYHQWQDVQEGMRPSWELVPGEEQPPQSWRGRH